MSAILNPDPILAEDMALFSLTDTIHRLRQFSQQSLQAGWHWQGGDLTDAALATDLPLTWPVAPLNERQQIAWAKGKQTLWLYQQVTVPERLLGYPVEGLVLRLALTWWAEDAQVFVNGQQVQSGDLFDYFTRICLSPAVAAGQTFTLALRLVSPGHDDGALVRSHLLYEVPPETDLPSPEPGFVADELEVLQHYCQALAPEKLAEIAAAAAGIDWAALAEGGRGDAGTPGHGGERDGGDRVDGEDGGVLDTALPTPSAPPHCCRLPFHQSLAVLRQRLAPLGDWLKQRQLHCQGHAHLDLAWLWPVANTWQAAERTFESVLTLQQDFPELTYTHSSPALFAWLEQHRPDLFQAIQQQVKRGRWSIDAGLWVEPELNIVSGEAIARQILYGQRYCQEKFGSLSPIAWLPDTFGFCWQLPQLLQLGGIAIFATQKLRWNDTTQFPHDLFHWQGPDGSQVLGWTLPPIGTDFDPVQIAQYAAEWETKTGLTQAFWLPGMGDHGGGPTRDMLEKARRWAASPFFPQVRFSKAVDFIERVTGEVSATVDAETRGRGEGKDGEESNTALPSLSTPPALPTHYPPLTTHLPTTHSLPIWTDELYLELHRGCYTTHADQKQQNRRSEDLLYQAELWATLAQLMAGQPYPKADLEQAWKTLLFNQFHDILPGSSIPEVFEDANRDWQIVQTLGQQVLHQSLAALANALPLSAAPHPAARPILVFNPHNWPRTEVMTVNLPPLADSPATPWTLQSADGALLPIQPHPTPSHPLATHHSLTFLAQNIPAIGYQLYWLLPHPPHLPRPSLLEPPHPLLLENPHLRVTLCPHTGDLLSLFDKRLQREALSGPGNQLQAFEDKGQYWDAWNIAPDYADHPLPPAQLKSLTWIETGPLRQRLQVVRQLNQSVIQQDYILDIDSPVLKIETWIHWQESQVVLKVAFPLALDTDMATGEIPFGAIGRPTRPITDADRAKWEVPALRWVDLSTDEWGVSLLTDCKHGFDVTPSQLRLTLLKAPLWPDPGCDRTDHHFTYAIYPHPGTWQQAQTVQQAQALNIPLTPFFVDSPDANRKPNPAAAPIHKTITPAAGQSLLSLGPDTVILTAFKPAEDQPHEFILRCYDACGLAAVPTLDSPLPFSSQTQVNLLEQPIPPGPQRPYQISTYRLAL